MDVKNRIGILCLVVSSMLIIVACTQPTKSIKCTLKGIVKDRPLSDQIILLKGTDNPFTNQGISIPILNGEFEYTFYCDHEELYQLVFYDEQVQMRMWPVEFISEQGVINFTLHPLEQRKQNFVEGGSLNNAFWDFQTERFNKQFDNSQDYCLWVLQYAKERPTIVGYSILIFIAQDFIGQMNDISPLVDVFQMVFEPKYPNHPYTANMMSLFRGSSLKAGIPFIDFTAVDMDGNPVRLSERIVGKPAVLHFWSSWCAPCRRTGMEMIPVYEEFRDKGFVVIGVARERNISTAKAAIELDKYPWENLVELNDTEQIWVKYGIGNVAGGHFLIDEKGTIITVSPSIEEIRNYLTNKL